jgi:NADH:ubiquinone oxidoreductase subunit 6 (subunit J)
VSIEQVVFVLAGAVCIVGAVVAVTHPDPRAAGAALLATLVALATVYAGLAAPAVATLVLVVALLATAPLVVHFSVPGSAAVAGGVPVAAAATLIGAALFGILAIAVAVGEVPVNVSLRSSDVYDVAALRDLLAGRSAAAAAGAVLVLLAALVAAIAARRHRHAA